MKPNASIKSMFCCMQRAYIVRGKELGYNVIHTSRKNKYTFARFVLANHLRHTMNMAWIPMGHVFNSKHHSSMMHCVSTYKDLVSTGDTEFCIIKDRVESLIKQYDANRTNKITAFLLKIICINVSLLVVYNLYLWYN